MKRVAFSQLTRQAKRRRGTVVQWLKLVHQYTADVRWELSLIYQQLTGVDLISNWWGTVPTTTAKEVHYNVSAGELLADTTQVYIYWEMGAVYYVCSGDDNPLPYPIEDESLWPWTTLERVVPPLPGDVIRYIATEFLQGGTIRAMSGVCRGWRTALLRNDAKLELAYQHLNAALYPDVQFREMPRKIPTIMTAHQFTNLSHAEITRILAIGLVYPHQIEASFHHEPTSRELMCVRDQLRISGHPYWQWELHFVDPDIPPLNVYQVIETRQSYCVLWGTQCLDDSKGARFIWVFQRYNDILDGERDCGLIADWEEIRTPNEEGRVY